MRISKVMLTLLGFTTFAFIASPAMQAQDVAVSSDTVQVYYEDENPNHLDYLLLRENICLETVLRLNPELDMQNVIYGLSLLLPVDEPCYDYDKSIYGWWNFSDGSPPRLKYYENGQWLNEPYYSHEVVYLRAESVEEIAQRYNVCVDDLLAENVLLQDFVTYQAFATLTSFDVFIPEDALPCDPNWVESTQSDTEMQVEIPSNDLTPIFIAQQYNVCAEEIRFGWYSPYTRYEPGMSTITIPTDALPCYNKVGQRLIYFDLQGTRLQQPVYSDLPVYLAPPGETMASIAERMNVCIVDLLRINDFPSLPTSYAPAEIFIPLTRSCPDDIEVHSISLQSTNLRDISLELDICQEVLVSLNSHLFGTTLSWNQPTRVYDYNGVDNWLFTPTNAEPCYQHYVTQLGDSIYDLERQLNVCYEDFIFEQYFAPSHTIQNKRTVLYFRNDTPPCYNEYGQRLYYALNDGTLYSDVPLHIFQPSDTVYSVSQQYNVCVEDIFTVNPVLRGSLPSGLPVFIPDTRPCYNTETGMRFIYEDEAGNLLPEPQVADQLIYYGSQPFGRVSYYYNVCINRIEAANQDKLERQSSYLGWIIPTDRPPCYDESGNPIDYACYNQPIDFSVDYTQVDAKITIDIDGKYCYDLAQPETVVWYNNQPYQIVDYENNMLTSRAFTAWCFGVSLDEINTINRVPDILSILPYHARAIPFATRRCYVQDPNLLDGYAIIHVVQSGETVTSIASQYGVPRQQIDSANDLDERHTLWAGQYLIIPDAE